jgi:hypothetical protein
MIFYLSTALGGNLPVDKRVQICFFDAVGGHAHALALFYDAQMRASAANAIHRGGWRSQIDGRQSSASAHQLNHKRLARNGDNPCCCIIRKAF